MVLAVPEHPVGSQLRPWGTRVYKGIGVNLIVCALHTPAIPMYRTATDCVQGATCNGTNINCPAIPPLNGSCCDGEGGLKPNGTLCRLVGGRWGVCVGLEVVVVAKPLVVDEKNSTVRCSTGSEV